MHYSFFLIYLLNMVTIKKAKKKYDNNNSYNKHILQ